MVLFIEAACDWFNKNVDVPTVNTAIISIAVIIIFLRFIIFFLHIHHSYAMDSTLYATIAIKASSSGIMAMLAPFRNDCTLGFFPASELKISFKARKTIKDITAITPRDITCVCGYCHCCSCYSGYHD